MSHRILTVVLMMICAAALSGCQMDNTAEDSLPPVSLAPPTIMAPVQLAAVRQPYIPPPMPVPVKTQMPKAPAKAPSPSMGAVPAAWIPNAPANHWMWIIIHHSDSDYGSAAIIDKWHRDKGWDELGYHFVIGNGTDSGDGQVEVGPRWPKQKWGAHDNTLDNRYNTNGIGICLVGNFEKNHPSSAQMHSLIHLVVYLMEKYNIPASRVLGHGETKTTKCPGRFVNMAEVREEAERIVARDKSASGGVFADYR